MSVSRRRFIADAPAAAGLFTLLLPELASAQASARASADETPHDSYSFWNGFYDSVNPYSPLYGQKAAARGSADQVPDPSVITQYLQYKTDEKKLRYATDIDKSELLDHDGDVSVSIVLSQYWPGTAESDLRASQLRVDTVQTHPYMNIVVPLGWTAIASLAPNKAGTIPSLDQLGFKSPQAMEGTSKIVLTQGTGKLSVNVSKASNTSVFVKALQVMITGAKIAAPLVSLPAVSVPALSSFTEVLSYWEDRTKFIMAGNLTRVVATQQALSDPTREDHYIGLVSGDYLMVPQKHTADLATVLPDLDLVQGYLVRKDADQNVPVETRAKSAVPNVTYATMRVTVQTLESSGTAKPASSDSTVAPTTSTRPDKSGSSKSSPSTTGKKP